MTSATLYDLYKDEWQFAEGVEDVTLTSPDGSSSQADVKAESGDTVRAQLAQLGPELMASGFDLAMILYQSTCNSLVPSNRWKVVRAGPASYTVISATSCKFDTQWLVTLRKDL